MSLPRQGNRSPCQFLVIQHVCAEARKAADIRV